jgi:uncharacterized protein
MGGGEQRVWTSVDDWENAGAATPPENRSYSSFAHPEAAGEARLPWETLQAAYAYVPEAAPAVTEELRDDPEYHLGRLTFRKPGGESHTGLLLRPRALHRYPVVLLLHALSRDKEEMIRLFGRPFAERGVATLALDAHLHGERRSPAGEPIDPLHYLELARENIVEYRQALDFLETRADLDARRVGLLGYSLGAMMGAILAGVDERVRACVFMVGGDVIRDHMEHVPHSLRDFLEPVSPANFVGRISPRPVFFLNGRHDDTVPAAAAELLHGAAREPKRVLWADAGHRLPPEVALQGVDWLVKELTPAMRNA